MSKIPDMSDPAVLDMVLRNHYPVEEWFVGDEVLVHCDQCHHEWPCPTIQAARPLAAARAERRFRTPW